MYALTPDLHNVIRDYVLYCESREDVEGMEAHLKKIRLEEEADEGEESEDSEDIEVPKVLGDIYESVAGAIYLDSGMSLDAVWGVRKESYSIRFIKFHQGIPTDASKIHRQIFHQPATITDS